MLATVTSVLLLGGDRCARAVGQGAVRQSWPAEAPQAVTARSSWGSEGGGGKGEELTGLKWGGGQREERASERASEGHALTGWEADCGKILICSPTFPHSLRFVPLWFSSVFILTGGFLRLRTFLLSGLMLRHGEVSAQTAALLCCLLRHAYSVVIWSNAIPFLHFLFF